MDTQGILNELDESREEEDSEEEVMKDDESTESSSNDESQSDEEEEKGDGSGPGQVRKLPQDVGSTRLVQDGGSTPLVESTAAGVGSSKPGNEKEKNNNKTVYPEWKGEKLFPPGGVRKANTSPTWYHGGFRKTDKGVVMKDVAVCSYCGKELKISGGSPTNFQQHLELNHDEKIKNVEEMTSLKQPKIEAFVKPPAPYKQDHPKQMQFRKNMTNWVLKAKRPLQIGDDEEFRTTIKDLDSRVTVPSHSTIRRDIRKKDKQKRRETVSIFKSIPYFTTTNDAGSSSAGSSFVNINAHYVDSSFNPQKKIIAVTGVQAKDHVSYRKCVDKALRNFGILDKTFCHTTDNEPTMAATFSRHERNGCFR